MVKYIPKDDMEYEINCECGNTSEREGFYPSDEKGNKVEPDFNWENYYVCDRCGELFKQI